MPQDMLGQTAALGTAVCWTFTALAFSAAGSRIGSMTVNLIRLVMAVGLLGAYGWLAHDRAFPFDASAHQWVWLSVSGLVGFTFGDLCLFRAFVVLGPRLSTLVMSLAPAFAASIGFLLLGETLHSRDLLGMGLTMLGVGWASSERRPEVPFDRGSIAHPPRPTLQGLALALGGAAGQGGGLVLLKFGMQDYDPFAATQIRVVAGIVGFTAVFQALGWWSRVGTALADRRAILYTSIGAFFGPFLGVSLSLLAVQHIESGDRREHHGHLAHSRDPRGRAHPRRTRQWARGRGRGRRSRRSDDLIRTLRGRSGTVILSD